MERSLILLQMQFGSWNLFMVKKLWTSGEWKCVPHPGARLKDTVFMVVAPNPLYVNDDGICVPDQMNSRSFKEDKANMQLISAAPDMYNLLEELYNNIEIPLGDYAHKMDVVMKKARGEKK